MLELELVCPPSPLQLVMARLVIVLGYDVGLGLALGLVLWAGGAEHVLALTLSWLMPLLLVVGLALLLSLRLPVQAAASLAYGSWLAILAMAMVVLSQLKPGTTCATISLSVNMQSAAREGRWCSCRPLQQHPVRLVAIGAGALGRSPEIELELPVQVLRPALL